MEMTSFEKFLATLNMIGVMGSICIAVAAFAQPVMFTVASFVGAMILAYSVSIYLSYCLLRDSRSERALLDADRRAWMHLTLIKSFFFTTLWITCSAVCIAAIYKSPYWIYGIFICSGSLYALFMFLFAHAYKKKNEKR